MNRAYVNKHLPSFEVVLFLIMYSIIIYIKPPFMYNRDGSLRHFGLGFKKKTVVPAWLVAIVLAVLAYVFMLYYVTIPRLRW